MGTHIINLKVHDRYRGRLQEVTEGFLGKVLPLYASLLAEKNGKLVNVLLSASGERIDFVFTTKPASLSEYKGFADWTNLVSSEYGAPPPRSANTSKRTGLMAKLSHWLAR